MGISLRRIEPADIAAGCTDRGRKRVEVVPSPLPARASQPFVDIARFDRIGRAEIVLERRIVELGDERMLDAFRWHCPDGPLLLIGTDCPALGPDDLRRAAQVLREGDDAVFLPAEDGGYVLIGLRQPLPALFDGIAWGTGSVMEATRTRMRAIGATWREPKMLWDVDRPVDLPRLDALWRDEAQRAT